MNKSQLIAAVAEKSGLTKKDSDKAISAVFDSISEALANRDSVQLVGFGTFGVKNRAARTVLNPRTGEAMESPETTVPFFKAGKTLKENVAK